MEPSVAAVIVAGGRGSRLGGSPKQYRRIGGVPVIAMSVGAFAHHPAVERVQPVIHPDDSSVFSDCIGGLSCLPPVFGGATRQDSVRAGLEALSGRSPDIVLVHDAARPFASPDLLARAIAAALAHGAAVPGLAVVDAIKQVDAEERVQRTLDRTLLRTVQTPQAFRFALLLDAHRRAAAEGLHDFPDDAALAEWAGMPVAVFAGEPENVKLTTPDDLRRAERDATMQLSDIRTATGFDVHAFADGDHVVLGGVRIPHDRALSGHSDADVALHALTDAVLGALADGDIGSHFPPSEERWRGAASDQFLAFAVERVRQRGGVIGLLDVTLLCEAPRIGPHRDAMRARIAEIAGIAIDRVAVKATTTEQLGFTGRREGIAAIATATIRLPGDVDER
jgi:2-C-methyl-D-erythritol 4-phosphate cytidylyltransferase / 2-C-methyl-D-erythritol 2,4-cyclodiphosphate synthase